MTETLTKVDIQSQNQKLLNEFKMTSQQKDIARMSENHKYNHSLHSHILSQTNKIIDHLQGQGPEPHLALTQLEYAASSDSGSFD
jgi:cytochrome oxidase Cu insertion factor (SCO1/SenC/PrrC family)